MIGQTRAFLGSLLVASDMQTLRLAHESLVKAYFDRPRVIMVSAKLAATGIRPASCRLRPTFAGI